MKKKLAATGILLVLLCQGPPQIFGGISPSFPILSFELITAPLHSPSQISEFLRREFQSAEDSALFGVSDYWQSPLEFWTNKAGDCEDYSVMANYLLRSLGYRSYVVSIYGKNYAHTVTLFRHLGKWHVINMGKLSGKSSKSLREAISRIHSGWEWAAVAKVKNHRGRLVKKFLRE